MPHRIPSILFIGQSKPQLGKVISDVTGIPCNSEGAPEKPEWAIDCKYYTANVNVKIGTFQTVPTRQDLVEALVIIFDSKNESSLGALFAYADQMMNAKKPDVCLAACENFGEGALESYENVSQFCQEHGFELIELAPLPEHVAGSENANEESARYESEDEFGPKRILNALLVNPWTGMNRKKWKPPGKAGESKTEGEGEAEKKEGEAAGDAAAVAEKNETEALVDACAAQMSTAFSSDSGKSGAASGSSGNASTSDSSMDDLLTKLKQVKARTAKLSDDDRKKYAERVAMSFANAMGVDD